MEKAQAPQSDFGLVWQAAKRWLPAAQSAAYRAVLTGEMIHGAGSTRLASDLTHRLIPGLAALGIEARLRPLPPGGSERQERPHPDRPVLLFGFASAVEFSPPEEIDDSTPLPENDDPQITAQALLSEALSDSQTGQHAEGSLGGVVLLPSRFSHTLTLDNKGSKERRGISLQGAVHRWIAWQAAYPQRAPREADLADPACGRAAAFLAEMVGTRRDFVSNRLRYAARCFEAAEIERAYRWLREAGLDAWQLPTAMAEALLTAPNQPLTDVPRRELIYLARAGTPTLKTLAARRLTYERHSPDARKTLHQLRFDSDPWVRAAARPENT